MHYSKWNDISDIIDMQNLSTFIIKTNGMIEQENVGDD